MMRLGLPENLERVLSSTNLIENLFSRVREIGRRVSTGRAEPWCCAGPQLGCWKQSVGSAS